MNLRRFILPFAALVALLTTGCDNLMYTCMSSFDLEKFTTEALGDGGTYLIVLVSWNTSFEVSTDGEGNDTSEIGDCDLYAKPDGEDEKLLEEDAGVDGTLTTFITKSTIFRIECWQACGDDIEGRKIVGYTPTL